MRYDTFQKIRKRQKEAAVAKAVVVDRTHPWPNPPSTEPKNVKDGETEGDMRNPFNPLHQRTPSRSGVLSSNKTYGIKADEREKRQSPAPTDLVDTVRAKVKAHQKSFLPIARPRTDPPQEIDTDDDYRSELETPDHVEVFQSISYESRTDDVSEITGVTYVIAPLITSRNTGVGFHNRFASHVEHLEEIEEVSESQVSYLGHAQPVQVDVTGFDDMLVASTEPGQMKYENRYGLPYETTDFRGDDEASEDSWGKAIVGNHVLHAAQERGPSAHHEPIDAEKYFTENFTNPSTPSSEVTHALERQASKTTPRSDTGDLLVNEKVLGDPSLSLFIDLSQIDDQGGSYEGVDSTTSPRKESSVKLEEQQPFLQKQPVHIRLKSPKSSQSAREKITKGHESAATSETMNAGPERGRQPKAQRERELQQQQQQQQQYHNHQQQLRGQHESEREPERELEREPEIVSSRNSINIDTPVPQDPPSFQAVGMKVQIPKPGTPAENSSSSRVNALLSVSIDFFTDQFKTLADGVGMQLTGLGSQLEKIDLDFLPEKEMNGMLGVLDKDLKAASESVPQGKDVVRYLGNQITENACVPGNTLEWGSAKNISMDFSSPSIEKMVDSVKETYTKNLTNCGIRFPEDKPALAPQTYMVPISLRGKAYDPDRQTKRSPRS